MTMMKIGEIAKRARIGIETIRYYEREGLLLEPERRPSGYRQYSESAVERLEFIRRAKDLGFTLAEVRELLELSFATQGECDHIRQRAETKLASIEDKIRNLQQMKRSLAKIIRRCQEKNSAEECPLVHRSKRKITL